MMMPLAHLYDFSVLREPFQSATHSSCVSMIPLQESQTSQTRHWDARINRHHQPSCSLHTCLFLHLRYLPPLHPGVYGCQFTTDSDLPLMGDSHYRLFFAGPRQPRSRPSLLPRCQRAPLAHSFPRLPLPCRKFPARTFPTTAFCPPPPPCHYQSPCTAATQLWTRPPP
jgi:hypothetical protein